MKCIVAVDRRWGIGKNNDLLFHLPLDMRHFRNCTEGKVVVMGSNTLKSFPGGNPLKNRVNIVLWPEGAPRDDCTVVHSLDALAGVLAAYPPDDVYVVGGAMFYRTMLPYCDEAIVTRVEADGDATVFFDDLDRRAGWSCADCSDPVTDGAYTLRFCRYVNAAVQPFHQNSIKKDNQ